MTYQRNETPEPLASTTSYLVAAIGPTKAVLAQCFAKSAQDAEKAVQAIAMDVFGQDVECFCIDTGASVNLWIEGKPEYIREVIASKIIGIDNE